MFLFRAAQEPVYGNYIEKLFLLARQFHHKIPSTPPLHGYVLFTVAIFRRDILVFVDFFPMMNYMHLL